MGSIDKLNDKATQAAFDKKVVSASQQLHPYVKHRLYIAQSMGVIPKNMYSSSGVIDEGIAKFYENGYDIDIEPNALKLKLFKFVDDELDAIFKKYKNAKIRWVQEEPANMGAWTYLLFQLNGKRSLELASREATASPTLS